MFNSKKTFLLAFALIISFYLQAQTNAVADTTEKTGFMRSEAKVYVVMVVVITILAGLILYMVRLDRKMTKLEKGGTA